MATNAVVVSRTHLHAVYARAMSEMFVLHLSMYLCGQVDNIINTWQLRRRAYQQRRDLCDNRMLCF